MQTKVVSKISKEAKQCLISFVSINSKGSVTSSSADKAVSALLKKYVDAEEFKGELGEALILREVSIEDANNLLLVGLGKSKGLDQERLRRATAFAYRALRKEKQKAASVDLDSLKILKDKLSEKAYVISESVELTNYKYTQFLSEATQHQVSLEFVASKAADKKQLETGVKQGEAMASGVNFARTVSDAPSNYMTPAQLAKDTQKAAKGSKLKVTVWDLPRIKKEKLGALIGVAQGSENDPRVIIMEYNGAAKSKTPIALVGKGLTFDTGGISIKPSMNMEAMKYDMCGGANTIGTMLAIAKLGLKVNVIAYVGAVENMPDGKAINPGDILTSRSGKTIEVINTDAEGRLVMSDLITLATEKKPASLFTMATLTGAVIVALGHLHTGIFSFNQKLIDKIKKSADEVGEDVWQLPVTDQHVKQMKSSPYADLSNMGVPMRAAGSAQAAAFLTQFVENEVPYAHFDIASQMSDMGGIYPYHPDKGACGAMVRTWVEYIRKA
ncbi:MAG: leucyl aminopeptidase [Bdellovibrionales bacterium]